MRTQLIGGGSILLTALLVSTASAQTEAPQAPIPGAVKHAGTYHVATQSWTRSQQTYGLLAQDALFRNDTPSGYFGLLDEDEIANDEGRLPGDGNPLLPGQPEVGNADCYEITGFQFGYCALNVVPTSYTISWLESYAPCSDPTGNPVLAAFDVTGLPNGGCWIVAVDLTGSTGVFELCAEGGDGVWDNNDDLDDFGWALNIDNGQGTNPTPAAGPILSGDNTNPPDEGNGTKFKNPTLTGTGLGTADFFWLTSNTAADGCFFFGGCLPCANFNATFFGDKADGGPESFCDPSQPNSVTGAGSGEGAKLASNGGFGTAAASFTVTDTPNQPGILFSGPARVNPPNGLAFGCGFRCVGGQGVLRFGPFFPQGNTLNVTIDMATSANDQIQWWYRDPLFFQQGNCNFTFNLSNGLGL